MGVRHTETNLIIWSKAAEPASAAGQAPKQVEPLVPLLGGDQLYDAGDKGCAFGPMDEIAALVRKLNAGQTLEIRASDPTVAFDLAAWCRMTGHTLVTQQGDRYLVRKN